MLETDVRRKMTSVLCQSPILEDCPINRHNEISSFCIHVIKCLSDTNLIPNPKEVVANEALGLKGTLCDAYTQGRESNYSAELDCARLLPQS